MLPPAPVTRSGGLAGLGVPEQALSSAMQASGRSREQRERGRTAMESERLQ